jgi:hypothetical protein
MRTAKAKSPPEATPKPKPGSVESIRRQTAELETATALLKGAPVAPKSAPKPAYAKVDDGAAAITEMCRLMLQVGRDNPTAEAIGTLSPGSDCFRMGRVWEFLSSRPGAGCRHKPGAG